MYIRLAKYSEFKDIQKIIELGRLKQNAEGNYHQWTKDYPSSESIRNDIIARKCYVCVIEDASKEAIPSEKIVATFVLNKGPEQSYEQIEGAWQDENEDYVVIHRLASNGLVKGIGHYCVNWVLDRYFDVRLDTHPDNQSMRSLIKKLDFVYCGKIIASDGKERMAFQKLQ